MMFHYPAALLLLLLLQTAAGLLIWRDRVRQQRLRRIGEVALIAELTAAGSRGRRISRAGLWLTAAAIAIIALARPTWGMDIIKDAGCGGDNRPGREQQHERTGCSSRLERARLSARALVGRLQGNEVGLIVFAGAAVVDIPPDDGFDFGGHIYQCRQQRGDVAPGNEY